MLLFNIDDRIEITLKISFYKNNEITTKKFSKARKK